MVPKYDLEQRSLILLNLWALQEYLRKDSGYYHKIAAIGDGPVTSQLPCMGEVMQNLHPTTPSYIQPLSYDWVLSAYAEVMPAPIGCKGI